MSAAAITGLLASVVGLHHRGAEGLEIGAAHSPLLAYLCIVAVLILAYLSNPTDAAFRSFLTDLSFQSHLRRLRSAAAQATSPSHDAHVLNFSNRIAISLRTPPYVLRSYGLFSTVSMVPVGLKRGSAPDSEEAGKHDSPFGLRAGYFIGIFGRWWAIDDGSSEDGRAEKDRLANSVMAMEAVDLKQVPPLGSCHKEARNKGTQAIKELSSSPVSTRDAPTAAPVSEASAPVVLELQQQLLDLQSTTRTTESKLQSELETLKTRKRDEDAVRADLKTKAKAAEEVKRQADHEHAEAAKRATLARATRQTALDRIQAATTELGRLDRKNADLIAKSDKSAKHRSAQESSLRKEVHRRQNELKEAETKARALASRVEELESSIEHRKAAIYARLMHPAINRQQMLPYAVMPAAVMPPWSTGPDRSVSANYGHPATSTAVGLDFGNVPAPMPPHSSFLEHRMQHHMADTTHNAPSASMMSFTPFSGTSSLSVNTSVPTRGVPLPLFSPPADASELSLTADDDGKEGEEGNAEGLDGSALSPMTPTHRALIPSTLLNMLDDDDDDILNAVVEPSAVGGDGAFPWPVTSSTSLSSSTHSASSSSQVSSMGRHPLSLNPDAKAFNFNRPLRAAGQENWAQFSPFD